QTLGTPPNTAIQKYLNGKKVPQLFVATGASKWGHYKDNPWTMGFQPDYVTEAIIYAKHILANVKDPKIGVLMQNDDYGKDYFNGFSHGLGEEPHTSKRAVEIGCKPAHYINNGSASIGTVMKPAGFENAQDIVTAYYIKDPPDPRFQSDKDLVEWKAFMQKYYPVGNLLDSSNAYGYAVSSLLHIVLKQCGDDLTRANIMKQAASL